MPPRRKKSPNVYPLANGRWQARLWRGGQLHKVTFDTRAEAEQYRDAIDLDWRLRSRGLAGIVRRRPGARPEPPPGAGVDVAQEGDRLRSPAAWACQAAPPG